MNDTQPHALYRLFDKEARLLYVGIAVNPGRRWEKHRDTKEWWLEVASITIEVHPSRIAVLEAERAAIITESPRYNVKHNGIHEDPLPQPDPDPHRFLVDAHETLQAMGGRHAQREVFTAGIAAGNRSDRDGVDQAIRELTGWSEHAVSCASIRDTTRNLEDAALLAHAARIVWCCYVYVKADPSD